MATVNDLKFTIVPGDSLDTIKVRIKTRLGFNEFDRETLLNYRRSFELLGVDTVVVPPGNRPPRGPRPAPSRTAATWISSTSWPASSRPATQVDAGRPRRGRRRDRVHRRVRDPAVHRRRGLERASDELQVRCDLEPNLPQTETFLSTVVAVSLP